MIYAKSYRALPSVNAHCCRENSHDRGRKCSEFICVSSHCDRKVERFAMRQIAALPLFFGSIDDMLYYPVFRFNCQQQERRGPVLVCVCVHTVDARLQGYTGPYQRKQRSYSCQIFLRLEGHCYPRQHVGLHKKKVLQVTIAILIRFCRWGCGLAWANRREVFGNKLER